MATTVIRNPAEFASALRVSLSADVSSLEMAALDDAQAGAAKQQQQGCDEARTARQVTLDQHEQPAGRFAFQ